MSWILLSLLSALFKSFKDLASKHNLRDYDPYVVAWAARAFSLIILLPLMLLVAPPALLPGFWIALLVSGTLNVVTEMLYMRALQASDISITVPMITFTPGFLLLTSPIVVGEFPSLSGVIGIVMIVAGSYTLNIRRISRNLLEPFRALLHETGPRLMLLVAFIWSITSNFDKIGVQTSSPLFWSFAINAYVAAFLSPLVLLVRQRRRRLTMRRMVPLLPVGIFGGLLVLFQMMAMPLTLVAYVIAMKRTSAVMSVFLGSILFKERGLSARLTGTLIMLAGVAIIALVGE